MLIFTCFAESFSQKMMNVDSLKKKLRETSDKMEQAKLNKDIANQIYRSNPDSAKWYADQALPVLENNDEKQMLCELYQIYGGLNFMQGKMALCEKYYNLQLKLAQEIGLKKLIASAYNGLGIVERRRENFNLALDYTQKAISISENLPEKGYLGRYYLNEGVIYSDLNNKDLAKKMYLKAKEVLEKAGETRGLDAIYNNLAILYSNDTLYNEAIEFFKKSKALYLKNKNLHGAATTITNIANSYVELKNYDEAEKNLAEAYDIQKTMNDAQQLFSIFINYAGLYIKQHNFTKAEMYLQKCKILADSSDGKLYRRDMFSNYAIFYEKQNDYKNAYKNIRQYILLSDSIFSDDLTQKIAELRTKFEDEKKQTELDKQAIEIKQQKNLVHFFITISILFLIVIILIFIQYRNKKRINAELTHKNSEIMQQKEEIHAQAEQLLDMYNELEKLTFAVSETANAIAIYDANFNLEWINSGFTKLYGKNMEEYIAKHGRNFFDICKNFITQEKLNECVAQKKSHSFEYVHPGSKKNDAWVSTTITPIYTPNNEFYKLVTIDSDITKMKDLENFKETLVQMVVHDMKNPLSSIILLSDINEYDEQFKLINMAANQLLTMVTNILDIQKFESQKLKLHLTANSVNELAEQAIRDILPLIELSNHSNIHLINQIDKPITALYDIDIIHRVLVNLLTNALKYSPKDGNIYLSCVTTEENGKQMAKISVRDEGVGIEKEWQSKIFEKYAQIEAKKSGIAYSTGLGLTFCKLSIESHGGTIGVDSTIGKGTTFWFTVPLA